MKTILSKCWAPFTTRNCRRFLKFCINSPSHLLQDCGDRLSLVAFSLVDQWSLDDADTYCSLSRVSNCRSQRNVPGRFISLRGDINWPARSPDLAPRGNSKAKVRRRRPTAVDQLKTAFQQIIAAVPQGVTRRVMQNFIHRLQLCFGNGDQHLND